MLNHLTMCAIVISFIVLSGNGMKCFRPSFGRHFCSLLRAALFCLNVALGLISCHLYHFICIIMHLAAVVLAQWLISSRSAKLIPSAANSSMTSSFSSSTHLEIVNVCVNQLKATALFEHYCVSPAKQYYFKPVKKG